MALASPWGSPLDWRPWRMILPPTGVDPIAGSGLAPYFRKRRKSLVRCALGTASDGVCGRNISPPSASDAAAALPVGRAVVLSVIIGLAMMRWPCGEPVEQPSVCCRVRRDSGCDCRSVGAIGRPQLCRTAKVCQVAVPPGA